MGVGKSKRKIRIMVQCGRGIMNLPRDDYIKLTALRDFIERAFGYDVELIGGGI
jgi:hypothetical protein